MKIETYKNKIKKFKIEPFGFDTHARALGITKDEAKAHWNEMTGGKFKRVTRTEYTFTALPEYSTWGKPLFRLNCQECLSFCMTPTAALLVPDGFITDKGSIPMIFQSIFSIEDREMLIPFLFHDVESDMQRMSRFATDGLVLEIGRELEAHWAKRNMIYAAVRVGNKYGGPDTIVNGFNVTQYNRDLIKISERSYLEGKVSHTNLKFT